MYSISKFIAGVSVALIVGGCSSVNYTSTAGFDFYVSEKKYAGYDCRTIRNYVKQYPANPGGVILKISGLDILPYPIPYGVLEQVVLKNQKFFERSIVRCGMKVPKLS